MSSPYDHDDAAPAATAASTTAFRIAEKKYQLHMEQRLKKTKNGRIRGGKLVPHPTDLSDVVDIRSPPQQTAAIVTHVLHCTPPAVLVKDNAVDYISNSSGMPATQHFQDHAAALHQHQDGQADKSSITALTFPAHPGLAVFPAALPAVLQLQLMHAALQQWPEPPTRTNHTAVFGLTLHGLFAAAQAGLALNELPTGQRQQKHQPDEQQVTGTECMADTPSAAAGGVSLTNGSACSSSSRTKPSISSCCQSNQQEEEAGTFDALKGIWCANGRGPKACLLLRKLRWASLGPPFNWTSRVYEPHALHRPLPPELITSATFFAGLADRCHCCSRAGSGGGVTPNGSSEEPSSAAKSPASSAAVYSEVAAAAKSYVPDVALVNYYHSGDTLNGHKDDVERDMTQPIVTMSLGCDAVFLMGGQTKDEPPTALLLRSGDVMVLSGPARSCYHGVPRILDERGVAADLLDAAGVFKKLKPVVRYMQQCRVNISVRATQ